MRMNRISMLAALTLAMLLCGLTVRGQEVVAVGKGSYASSPPSQAGKGAAEMMRRTFPIVGEFKGKAVPTNQYWTWLLNGKIGGDLWVDPLRVDSTPAGLDIFYPTRWADHDPVCEQPLKVEGVDFKANEVHVTRWGDWNVSFAVKGGAGEMEVTLVRGMPLVWIEPRGVELALRPSGTAKVGTVSAGAFVLEVGERTYGVFLPSGSSISNDGGLVTIKFAGSKRFAVIAAMTKAGDLAMFAKTAYSIPRDTRMEWGYDAPAGKVVTTWTIKTDNLEGNGAANAIQGFLPHHYRDATPGFKLDGPEYLSARGKLKTAVGTKFEITYDFEGILPGLPAPKKGAGVHPFDASRMAGYLAKKAEDTNYGNDTYWGGKDVLKFPQYMQFAKELGDPSFEKLKANGNAALADWMTYTPGEHAHYFARYENWKALVGFKDSYDSAKFNDQHFHYGYYTLAGAMQGMEDPAFLKDYGPMLTLVAKAYANWDRTDPSVPHLRCFDVWEGHSWASGTSSPGGSNQESSSEAVQSWAGLFLLGEMLGDKDMAATGAMGYAMETRATQEYWFNVHGDVLPEKFGHPMAGMVWAGGYVYGTYFSGDPAWIYGIQVMPASPAMVYLVRDYDFALKIHQTMMAERKKKERTDDYGTMGDLGNVLLAHLALIDPEAAVAECDRLWDANNDVMRKGHAAGVSYYLAHSYRSLGKRAWDIRTTLPMSGAFRNASGEVTYVLYNPDEKAVSVAVRKDGRIIGSIMAPPRQLLTTTLLAK